MSNIRKSLQFEQSNLVRVRNELLELQSVKDPEARPTLYAFGKTRELLSAVGAKMESDFPYGYVLEDGDGGILIEWENQSKHVRLIVPAEPTEQPYIHHQHNEARDIDEASAERLADWLHWLNNLGSYASSQPPKGVAQM